MASENEGGVVARADTKVARGSEVISVRVPAEEAGRLQEAAENAEQSVSGLVRKAVEQMLAGGQPSGPPSVDTVSSGARNMTVRHGYGGSTTEAPFTDFSIPDSPPSTVQGNAGA